MKWFKGFIGCLALGVSLAASGQSTVIRGEASAGVYENLKSTSQSLNVTVTGTVQPTGINHISLSVSTGLTSTAFLAFNAARKYIQIQNQDATNPIWVRCDSSAATADGNSTKVAPGQTWAPLGIPTGSCFGIATGAPVVTNVVWGS